VNGGPAAVSTQMTTLGTNLLELDSLLDELDAVELSDDILLHSGVGEFILSKAVGGKLGCRHL